MDELNLDIISPLQNVIFIQHLFTVQWQYFQFSKLKSNLPHGWLLQVMDFAKNRTTLYEGEIKAAFYAPGQISMHPVVSYYNTAEGSSSKSLLYVTFRHKRSFK